jgi:hypothetical protein
LGRIRSFDPWRGEHGRCRARPNANGSSELKRTQLSDRAKIMGSVATGTAKENGYPRIGSDVTIGAGARMWGPSRSGTAPWLAPTRSY